MNEVKTEQTLTLSLVSLERGEGALAWASVAIDVEGVTIVVHGISIVRDGPELGLSNATSSSRQSLEIVDRGAG